MIQKCDYSPKTLGELKQSFKIFLVQFKGENVLNADFVNIYFYNPSKDTGYIKYNSHHDEKFMGQNSAIQIEKLKSHFFLDMGISCNSFYTLKPENWREDLEEAFQDYMDERKNRFTSECEELTDNIAKFKDMFEVLEYLPKPKQINAIKDVGERGKFFCVRMGVNGIIDTGYVEVIFDDMGDKMVYDTGVGLSGLGGLTVGNIDKHHYNNEYCILSKYDIDMGVEFITLKPKTWKADLKNAHSKFLRESMVNFQKQNKKINTIVQSAISGNLKIINKKS